VTWVWGNYRGDAAAAKGGVRLVACEC
jgi:hypothetical protein